LEGKEGRKSRHTTGGVHFPGATASKIYLQRESFSNCSVWPNVLLEFRYP
jgi:hypothetical protein